MTPPIDHKQHTPKIHRIVTASFGVFFVALAIAILLCTDGPMTLGALGALGAALALGLLGAEACFSAARNKRSLVERMGPWP